MRLKCVCYSSVYFYTTEHVHMLQVLNFLSSKTAASYMMRRNPRETAWTVLYRKKHKKGAEEEAKKRRTRRTVKFQRAVQGATLETILAKRNQKPEVRKAQREQQIRAAKEKAKHKEAQKAAKGKAQQSKIKPAKPVKASAPRVGGKR